MSYDNLSLGYGGVSRFSGQRGRTADGTNRSGVRYPSPFFDIAHTYLPPSMKALLRWCRYYYLVNPLVNTVIHKMSEYPVTEIVIDEKNQDVREKWETLLGQHLRYRAFQIEVGLDYYTYGICAVTIHFPFTKYLICKNCEYKEKSTKVYYKWRNLEYIIACDKCGHEGPAAVLDYYERDLRRIRLMRWNPEYINVDPGFGGADPIYTFELPLQLKNDLILGKKTVLDTIPDIFVEAMRRNKYIRFSDDNICVFKRPIISQKDNGWGMPLIMPVLKDAFYLQILRKAQECVSLSTLIETTSGLKKADDVRVGEFVRTHLGRWRKVEKKWYRDAKEDEIGRRLTLSGLRSFPATYSPHHPILTLRRNDVNRRSDTLDKQRSSTILKNSHLWEEVICPAEKFEVGDYVLYPRVLPAEDQILDVAKYTGLITTDKFVYSGVGEDTAEAFEKLEEEEYVPHDNAGSVAKHALKEGRSPKRMEASRPVTKDLAYILGWYVGDGSCGSRHVTFNLEDGMDDPTSLKLAIQREFGVEATEELIGSNCNVVLSDVIVRLLVKGLIPGTARTKRVPEEILNGPDPVKLSFLRGLWEADGCVREHQAILSTSSRELSYDVYRMLLHLGCISTVSYHIVPASTLKNGRVIKETDGYHVTVTTASKDRLLSLWECGQGQSIESGKSGFFWKNYFASRVCAIAEVEEDQYIDFKIEEDSTFCTAGTATKNSIAQEHIVPLRVLFPQAGSNTSDPYTTIDLNSWKQRIEGEIAKWKYDCVSLDSLVEGFDPSGPHQESLMGAGDVREGFYLRNHLGAVSKVAKVWRRPMRKGERAFKLHMRGLSAVQSVVSEGHPFYAARKLNNGHGHKLGLPEFVRVKDLRAGDYVGYPILRRKGLEEQYVHDRELAWVVGLYLAEGNVTSKQVLFSLHKDEVELQNRLRKFFLEHFEANSFVGEKSENGIQLVFSSVEAARFFTEMCHGTSVSKRIHSTYMQGGDDVVLPLLQGLLDGDGCRHEDGKSNKFTYTTISRQLAEDARQLFFSLGIPVSLSSTPEHDYKIGKKTGHAKEAFHLALFSDSKRRFLELLEGKKAAPVKDLRIGVLKDGYFWHRIRSIEEVEAVEVIGFEMEKDSTVVKLSDDTEAHGTFCLWGMASANSNYIPILPVPIGNETIGGDGKALGIYQEMDVWSRQIVAGMGVPEEFVYGGLQYSGSNVSMRMLENMFIGYRLDHENMLNNFVIRRIANFMQWPMVRAHMKRFKMADDLQRSAFYFQLNQADKMSDQTLLSEVDQDAAVEEERKSLELGHKLDVMRKQQLAQADIQGEMMVAQSRYQAKAQQQLAAAGGGGAPGGDVAGAGAGGGAGGPEAADGQQQAGGQDPNQMGGPPTGQQGEMTPGQQADPSMPEGSTVSAENAQSAPGDGIPLAAASPLQMGQTGGGYNLLYLAKRAASQLKKVEKEQGPMQAMMQLNRMRMGNPKLGNLVLQIFQQQKGSQANPLDPMQSPQPMQRPTRRAASTGV